jgi:hypothetical protein
MNRTEDVYRREADYLLRESMNKLKGLIDLLYLGVMDSMDEEEKLRFMEKIRRSMDLLYQKLDESISRKPE